MKNMVLLANRLQKSFLTAEAISQIGFFTQISVLMKTLKTISIVMAWAFGLCLLLVGGASTSIAQQVISYQGSVTQNSVPVSGTHNVVVSIYPIGLNGTAIYT
ncbi:MAG TPA: hypothetical protein VFD13_09530, partial [Candidatus Kapabacteria bacterium]|nr:hypothetical protein [Candidatus Kapabacteria bacterium]